MYVCAASRWHSCRLQVLRLRPGDYSLGSPQSRATARALLEARFAVRRRIDAVSSVPRPGNDGGIRIGTLMECDDGSLFRNPHHPGQQERADLQSPLEVDGSASQNSVTGSPFSWKPSVGCRSLMCCEMRAAPTFENRARNETGRLSARALPLVASQLQ